MVWKKSKEFYNICTLHRKYWMQQRFKAFPVHVAQYLELFFSTAYDYEVEVASNEGHCTEILKYMAYVLQFRCKMALQKN